MYCAFSSLGNADLHTLCLEDTYPLTHMLIQDLVVVVVNYLLTDIRTSKSATRSESATLLLEKLQVDFPVPLDFLHNIPFKKSSR
jgi:hypothetical protein